MTITAQVPRSGPFSGNGSTVAFTYGFLIDVDAELVVVVRNTSTNVITQKALTTDYSVAGVGTVSGGTVTFVTAPKSSEQVAFLRAVPLVQDLDLQNRGVVSPELLEDQLDELTRITQDHAEQLSRAVLADLFGIISIDDLVLNLLSIDANVAAAAASAAAADVSADEARASALEAALVANSAATLLRNVTLVSGGQLAFTLDHDLPLGLVFIDGVQQSVDAYSYTFPTLTFTETVVAGSLVDALFSAGTAAYSLQTFETVTNLLADTVLAYDNTVVGTSIVTRKEGFAYEVAAAAATDQHVTTAGGLKLYVIATASGRWPLGAWGATLDGVADDAAFLLAAFDAVKVVGINDAPPIIVVRPGETLRLATSVIIDNGSAVLEGFGATLQLAANYALDIGNATYLSNIAIGNNTFILRGFRSTTSAGFTAIRNRGYRKLWIEDTKSVGGATFLETEGAFAGSGMRRCRIQNCTGKTVQLKQRNNNWTFDNTTITGGGDYGVHISTVSAEMKGIQWVGRNDIEGCAGGIFVSGQAAIIGIDGLWFESNTVANIVIDNTPGSSNKDAISITRCNITGGGVDVLIGTDAAGTEINGVIIEANEFADSDLVVISGNKVKDCRIGPNRMSGTGVYNYPAPGLIAGNNTHYRIMPLYDVAPVVPFATSDTKGVLGDIRWESGEAWIKTMDGWMWWQVGAQADAAIQPMASGATPSVVGRHKVRTNNGGATTVTNFTGGKAGQEIMIFGIDGGNTTISHVTNIRLAGGVNFTLGDNDVITLVCRDGTVWNECSRSNNN